MDELTKRLREIAEHAYDHPYANLTPEIAAQCSAAADEIDRLRALVRCGEAWMDRELERSPDSASEKP